MNGVKALSGLSEWNLSFFFQVNDRCALSQSVKEEMYKCYPNAKRAHLKDGGNFPYMSRSAEVNVYIQVSSWYYLCTLTHWPLRESAVILT